MFRFSSYYYYMHQESHKNRKDHPRYCAFFTSYAFCFCKHNHHHKCVYIPLEIVQKNIIYWVMRKLHSILMYILRFVCGRECWMLAENFYVYLEPGLCCVYYYFYYIINVFLVSSVHVEKVSLFPNLNKIFDVIFIYGTFEKDRFILLTWGL